MIAAYATVAFYLYEDYKQRNIEIDKLENQVTDLTPSWEKNQHDLSKLNELDDVLTNKWPLASFEKIVSHLPGKQKLRFQIVEVQTNIILIKGASPNINLINNLFPALKSDSYFKSFEWRMPAPVLNERTKLWEFTLEIIKPA